jgi:hypothetical protein
MKPAFATRLGRRALYLVAIVICAAMLHALAWYALRAQFVADAAQTTAVLARGDTPYRWQLASRNDLVADRVFGTNAWRFDDRGLVVVGNGETFQVGLILSGTVDLAIYGPFELDAAGVAASQTTLVVREALGAPMRFALVPPDAAIDLAELPWTDEFGAAVSTPQRIAMLRVQARTPVGDTFHLHAARLLPRDANVAHAPWTHVRDVGHVAATDTGSVPRYTIDGSGRVETAMQQRDRLRKLAPAALVVVDGDVPRVEAAAARLAPAADHLDLRWPALVLYVAALALLRLRPPRCAKLRGLLEAAGTLAAPFGLVIGGFVGDNPDAWTFAVAAATFVFALSLAPVGGLAAWRWFGDLRAWYAPIAVVLFALVVAALGHDADAGLRWPGRITFLRYLAWAALQQYLICVVLADRLAGAGLSPRWIALAAALVFALLHTPNEALMFATFAGGLVWSATWLTHRALVPIALSHAASATILIAALPPSVLRSAEVSARFFL